MTPSAEFVPAWAKINLTLSILSRREDGYHTLASVMQTISLCDTLRIETTDRATVTCAVDVPDLATENNLVVRAVRLLQAEGLLAGGASLELRKEIPSPGGLGGGSSDAAAVLCALERMCHLGLSQAELERLGAQLGSDVPFFVRGGTALIEGRGEYVTPLPDCEPLWLIIARPPISISTAAVFRMVSQSDFGNPDDTDAIVAAIRAGGPLPLERLSNSLESIVHRAWPAVAATRDAMLAAGAPIVRMSGSGPTLFAPFRGLSDASTVLKHIRSAGIESWLCHTITRHRVAESLPSAI